MIMNGSKLHYESVCCHDNYVRWGNALGPIWQARGMALLGGYSYSYHTKYNDTSWISYLPKTFEPIASKINHTQFEKACHNCNMKGMNWLYPDWCHGAIDFIQDIITNETRTALTKWFEANERVIPEFGENDWYIYDRCSSDTIFAHPLYGPLRFQAMKVIDENVENIYIVAEEKQQRGVPLCAMIMEERINYMKNGYPAINISFVGKDIANDFMTLVFAKHVIIAYKTSSFAQMATLANNGNVYRAKYDFFGRINVIPNGTRLNENSNYFINEFEEALWPNNKHGIKKNEYLKKQLLFLHKVNILMMFLSDVCFLNFLFI